MAKRRFTLTINLPKYVTPRNKWRKLIHEEVITAQRLRDVRYTRSDKLEIKVLLNLSNSQSMHHDIDNRLKDILDALQGRAGGTKGTPTLTPIIPNDNQIFRVFIEKTTRPENKLSHGKLKLRKLQRY